MKVFFSAAKSAEDKHGKVYLKIVEVLKLQGIQVYDDTKTFEGVSVMSFSETDKKQEYRKMIKEMDKADFSVFEASWPSTIHVGLKITLSFWKNKPVIALYRKGKGFEPILFKGIDNKKVLWIEYDDDNLEIKLLETIEKAKKMLDLRFNLFIPRNLMTYLDWVVKDVGVNKSEYIRMLIEKGMKEK